MDLTIRGTENGGIEASQTFLVRKTSLTPGNTDLALFVRSSRWEQIYPEVPQIWRALTIKTVGEGQEVQPGIVAIRVDFTGYLYANNGSSGEEETVPTTSLRGNLQDGPLIESKAWQDLTDGAKTRLGWMLYGSVKFDLEAGKYGSLDDITGIFTPFDNSTWPDPTDDELTFARMINQGKTTCPLPSWNYVYRTESKTGFTAAQLNTLNKIVTNPPGDPTKPSADWTWLLVGPDQSQSGPDRFIKELSFQLIPNTDENQMLHRP